MTLLTRWDPLRDLASMQNRLNRFVRESYSPEGPEEALTTTSFAPPVDIYEDEHSIAVKMEVPGIDEKDIDVRIESNTLTVHAHWEQPQPRFRTWSTQTSARLSRVICSKTSLIKS